jgi:hypothetical protein
VIKNSKRKVTQADQNKYLSTLRLNPGPILCIESFLTENHHILLSVGRDFDGPNLSTAYLGYQFTFGPKEQKTSLLLQPKK